jgi:hypothetical protein
LVFEYVDQTLTQKMDECGGSLPPDLIKVREKLIHFHLVVLKIILNNAGVPLSSVKGNSILSPKKSSAS